MFLNLFLITVSSSELPAFEHRKSCCRQTLCWLPGEQLLPIGLLVLDYLWLFHLLNAAHFENSNAYNFLCDQKHQVWVGIFLVRTWRTFWYQNNSDLLKNFDFAFSAPPLQWVRQCMWAMLCNVIKHLWRYLWRHLSRTLTLNKFFFICKYWWL